MTRYFYPASRSHHAYAMAKDFGMEFERRFGKWDAESLPHISGTGYRLYVHVDSLHLLEPLGDDVVLTFDIDRYPIAAKWSIFGQDVLDWNVDRPAGTRIIQRAGTAFHYPEVEP